MNPHRWRQIEQVCQEALAREGAVRAAYLDTACGTDTELRREVESLLAQQSDARGFLEGAGAEPGAAGANLSDALPDAPLQSRVALSPGARLGPYEIAERIGAGGMGEVYRGRDTRLGRTVAIKVLPPGLASDPDRRRRFEQEARAASALNHPNICTLHDIGTDRGIVFLVMEFLDGQTLAERLRKGRLPLAQALEYGAQIADALSKAHRQGIVHRDLKPGNIMLTKSGAKLLDFGVAKLKPARAASATAGDSELPTQEPTTTPGMVVGTVSYMAPEQLEGRETDARADLFGFGCVLYEMLTGRGAFAGDSEASIISAVMTSQPPSVSSLQPITPPALDRLVTRCLAKDPDERADSAHDVADELRWLHGTSGAGALSGDHAWRRRRVRAALAAVGGLVLFVTGAGLMWLLRPVPARPSFLARLSLDVDPAEEVNAGTCCGSFTAPAGSRTAFAWTPDGQAVVFVGRRGGMQQLYVRRLDAAEARPLANTKDAWAPAVSADGQWVAFWAHGAIRKIPLGGGPVMDLAPAGWAPPWGLVWDARGCLFFGWDSGPIWTIPPDGKPAAVTTVGNAELAHTLPWPLPDGQTLLYTVRKRWWSWGDEEVVAQTLATGARKVLLKDAVDVRYVPTGHLVFLRRGVLFAVPFDAARLEVRGTPVPVLDSVAQALTGDGAHDQTGAGQFAIAATGALAWVPAPVVPYPDATLVTVDRHGQVAALPAPVRSYAAPRVSPDGRRLAVVVQTITEGGLWVYDLDRGTLSPLARGGEVLWPLWSPDGLSLLFDWRTEGRPSLAIGPADGTAPPRALVPGLFFPTSFAPDGRHLAAAQKPDGDMVTLTIEDGQARVDPSIEMPHGELSAAEFSPDGRWLAYTSDVSGRAEVYVRPYPGPGAAQRVSIEGGWSIAWAPTGRELFFEADGRMMSADFVGGSPPRIGRPRPLFRYPGNILFGCGPARCYDVAPDGQHFYGVQTRTPPPPPKVTHLSLIQSWVEELKVRVPTEK